MQSNVRKSLVRVVALSVVVTMPLLGLAGVASAKAAKGSAAWCAAHPKKQNTAICANASGGTGSGGSGGPTGTGPDPIVLTVSPNPLVETGQSEIHAVLQVETSPSLAGDTVTISSSQLTASCGSGVEYENIQSLGPFAPVDSTGSITAVLDDDGNATVDILSAFDCAPGSDVIEADLTVAPYDTALATLVAAPPVTTTAGVTGYPNDEVETGDTNGISGNSDVYAVFYVETDPVYAEQTVEINSDELEARCGLGWIWYPGNGESGGAFSGPISGTGSAPPVLPFTTLDDDGNAVFVFEGASCAAGDSEVIADVLAGSHPTYTFTYTIDAPAPTI
jgi:hypothetical protein